MPLTTTIIPLVNDSFRLEDIVTHRASEINPQCPYCEGRIRDHEPVEEDDAHSHGRLGTEANVCRTLYECQDRAYYLYQDIDHINHWTIARLSALSSSENVNDSEILSLPNKGVSIKPRWRFDTSLATTEDFTESISHNLSVGLEIELDWASRVEGIDELLQDVFGHQPSGYHQTPPCPACHDHNCWSHVPPNLIRGITSDSSISGEEFLIYGSTMSSEEFVRRFPLDAFKQYFTTTERDSIHSHMLLLRDVGLLPTVIIKNLWQLYRFYYLGWVYLFGNYSRNQGFLRQNEYATFARFAKTPFAKNWKRTIMERGEHGGGARNGLWLGGMTFSNDSANSGITKFDAEIRTPDASLDLEQIVGLRALSKAIVVRAAQLSNYGLISVETDKKMWESIKETVAKVNSRAGITKDDEEFMKLQAMAFLKEVASFLTEFERKCIVNLITTPVRERSPSARATTSILKPISDTATQLKKLITLTTVEAPTKDEWLRHVSKILLKEPREIEQALSEIKAYYDVGSKSIIING